VFLYHEGLVRFCTTPYRPPTSKNLACSFMHLTNYAVNKHNTAAAFVAPTTAAAAAAAAGPATRQQEQGAGQTQQQLRHAGDESNGGRDSGCHVSNAGCVNGAECTPGLQKQQQEQQQDRQQQQQEGQQQEGKGDSEAGADQSAGGAGCDASKWSFQQLRQHLEAHGEQRGLATHTWA
jgi:hypothetical protein